MKLFDKLTPQEVAETATAAILILSTHPDQELISKELRQKLLIIAQSAEKK